MKLICWLTILSVTALAQVNRDPKLRASRDTYHPAMEILRPAMGTVSDAQLSALKKLPLEAVWGAVQALGYKNCYFAGLIPTRPTEKLVGRALTIRYLPTRPDLDEAMKKLAVEGDWPPQYNKRAAEEAKPGDVVVVDLGGLVAEGVFMGDVSALGMKTSGANGVLLYGSSRDLVELQAMEGFPVFAVGYDPRPAYQMGVDWNIPIRVGNVTVLPGDVVVADAEAALFFPAKIAEEVIRRATRVAEQEDYERALVRQKKYKFRDVYPLNPELMKQYEKERKK